MINIKKIGVWLDHTKALIIEEKNNALTSYSVESISKQIDKQNFGMDESQKQNSEHNQLSDFYKRLTEILKGYSEVLLFGPTNAKTELHNLLKTDRHFDNVTIDVETTDNLTENQMREFVKEHFEKAGKPQ